VSEASKKPGWFKSLLSPRAESFICSESAPANAFARVSSMTKHTHFHPRRQSSTLRSRQGEKRSQALSRPRTTRLIAGHNLRQSPSVVCAPVSVQTYSTQNPQRPSIQCHLAGRTGITSSINGQAGFSAMTSSPVSGQGLRSRSGRSGWSRYARHQPQMSCSSIEVSQSELIAHRAVTKVGAPEREGQGGRMGLGKRQVGKGEAAEVDRRMVKDADGGGQAGAGLGSLDDYANVHGGRIANRSHAKNIRKQRASRHEG